MALQYSPKIINDGLVLCLDASQNTSLPTIDLPVKDNLLLWLDASDDSTFSYSSGTEVSQWRDKSGNNFHANQSTVANQPSRSNIVNSRKTVNFVAANGDFIRVSSGIVTPNYITVFAVVKPATQSNSYAVILEQDHGNGYNGWVIQRNNNVSQWLSWVSGNGVTWLNPNYIGYTDNTPQIVTLRKNSTTLNLYSNAATNGAVSISDNPITQSSYGINLGYWQYGGGRYYNGEICEILVYNRGLSDVELNRVNTYLGLKWNISNTDRSIFDLSGNNNNGLLGNGTVADMPVADYYNKGALRFDGSSDYLAVADNVILNPTNVTVSMWLKRNAYQSSICNFLRRNDRDAYALMATSNTDTVWFRIRNAAAAVVDATTTMPLNTWTNLVGTYDGVNVKIYKNGTLANTVANSSISYAGSTIGDLIIARDDIVSGRYAPINVGSVMIYNRALNATEISQNYEAQKSKFADTIIQQGLIVNLDAGNPYSYAGAGTTWYDTSGNGYNATINGAIVYNSSNGGSFDTGSSGTTTKYITIPSAALNGRTAWTVQFWMNINATNSDIDTFLTCGAGNDFLWFFRGRTNIEFQNTSGSNVGYSTTIGEWFLFTATGSSGTITIYKNGININSFSNTTTITVSSTVGIVLGQEMDDNTTLNFDATQAFLGRYGMVSFYNRALSAAEVIQNYNATKGRFGL